MGPRYTLRTTLWESAQGELLQVSVAVLDDLWEPQAEVTTPVGPFDDKSEALAETLRQVLVAAWWCTDQQRLPI